jgi:hypothetical protein
LTLPRCSVIQGPAFQRQKFVQSPQGQKISRESQGGCISFRRGVVVDIAAGESNYAIEDSYALPVDVSVVSVYPHAHYLAKEMRGTATLPDGTEKPLIWIKQWDVRWQDQYRFKDPIVLPKGTTLRMRFTYDNSSANPRSPRPPRRVTWGQNSTDEMGALWVEVIPRRSEDGAVLTQDYFRRALAADIASAELQVRNSPKEAAAHNRLALKRG